ncbi:MAG: porin [Pseudomonadota bacterium]
MRNFLLGSAALGVVMGFGLFADAAEARKATKPALKVSGRATATYHIFSNKDDPSLGGGKGEKGYGSHFAMEDSRLNFDVIGRMDWLGQMFYDWRLGITGDTGVRYNSTNHNPIEENRLRIKGEWGTVLFGNAQGVENFMARGAFGVMGATGGFDGNFQTVINRPSGVLLTTDLVGSTKYATKVSYITPRLWGFQLGASYAPNSEHKGQGKDGSAHNRTSTKSSPPEAFGLSNWSGAVNFMHEFANGFSVALSATGLVSHTKSAAGSTFNSTNLATANQTAIRERAMSYAIGGVAEFRGFELGAEWIDNGDSRQVKNLNQLRNLQNDPGITIGKFDAGEAYSFAAGYTYGPDKVAVGYYHSERKYNGIKAEADIYSVTYDRKLAPGLSVFVEYNKLGLNTGKAAVDYDNELKVGNSDFSSGKNNNDTHAVALGAKFKF